MHQDFIKLYDEFFDDIYRYIYFKTGNQWDTDDLVSEVFRKAFEKHKTLKGQPKAWLLTIARNTVIDYYRKKKDIAIGGDLDLYTYPHIFEQDIEKDEELGCLKKSLKSLSGEELEIITLKYFTGMKYEEIGKLLGKSEDSVKMKSFRIIRKLKELFKEYMEG